MRAIVRGEFTMAKKDKAIAKTLPMRALDETGVPYEAHEQSHKVIISAGRPDVGLALAPDGMVRAMGAQVGNLCEEE